VAGRWNRRRCILEGGLVGLYGPANRRDLFIKAFKEADAWLPSSEDAALALIEDTATAIAQDENQLEEQAQSFRRLDFDEAVTYASFPRPYEDLASMLWFYHPDRSDHFEEMRGLPRLRKAVREIVDR
jgi:hypothetical protein